MRETLFAIRVTRNCVQGLISDTSIVGKVISGKKRPYFQCKIRGLPGVITTKHPVTLECVISLPSSQLLTTVKGALSTPSFVSLKEVVY